MAQPIITVIGTVATQPGVQTTNRGTPYTGFRLAQTERRLNPRSNRWEDGQTSWYSVTCWRSWAENVAQSLKVGQQVVVTGRLKVREFQTDGNARQLAEIHAISIGHDLRRGTSEFTKVTRQVAEIVDEDDEVSAFHKTLADQDANDPWSAPADGTADWAAAGRDQAARGGEPGTAAGPDSPFGASAADDEASGAEKRAA